MRDTFTVDTLSTMPEPLEEAIAEFIGHVTRRLSPIDPDVQSGSLTFELDCPDGSSVRMKSYCWCDRDDCAWCGDLEDAGEWTLDTFEAAGYVEHQRAPNLWLRVGGKDVRIWWYKHAGRSLTVSGLSSLAELDVLRGSFDAWAEAHAEQIAVVATYEAVSRALGMMSTPLADAIAGAFADQMHASDEQAELMSSLGALLPDMHQAGYAYYQTEQIEELLAEHEVPEHDDDEDTPPEFVMRFSLEARLRRLLDLVDVKSAVTKWRAMRERNSDLDPALDGGPFETPDENF